MIKRARLLLFFLALQLPTALAGSPALCNAVVKQSQIVNQVFRDYAPTAKPGWCSGNVYFELKKILQAGGSLDEISVLYFYNINPADFRLWGTADKKLNSFHVSLLYKGLIYDVHSENSEPVPLQTYIANMFFADGNMTSNQVLLDILKVREFSGADYMTAFKQHGSSALGSDSLGHELGSLRDILSTRH
jgi:hypothetical protein